MDLADADGSGDEHRKVRFLVMDARSGGFANPWLDRRDGWLAGEKLSEAS